MDGMTSSILVWAKEMLKSFHCQTIYNELSCVQCSGKLKENTENLANPASCLCFSWEISDSEFCQLEI